MKYLKYICAPCSLPLTKNKTELCRKNKYSRWFSIFRVYGKTLWCQLCVRDRIAAKNIEINKEQWKYIAQIRVERF